MDRTPEENIYIFFKKTLQPNTKEESQTSRTILTSQIFTSISHYICLQWYIPDLGVTTEQWNFQQVICISFWHKSAHRIIIIAVSSSQLKRINTERRCLVKCFRKGKSRHCPSTSKAIAKQANTKQQHSYTVATERQARSDSTDHSLFSMTMEQLKRLQKLYPRSLNIGKAPQLHTRF